MIGVCPVESCSVEVPLERLMCRKHWYMVPQGIRNQVWGAWKRREAAQSSSRPGERAAAITAHLDVKQRAIRAVEAKLMEPELL